MRTETDRYGKQMYGYLRGNGGRGEESGTWD